MITQLVHILKKDIRYTRWELGLYFLISIAYVWQEVRRAVNILYWQQPVFWFGNLFSALVGLVAIYLIVRVVHAEAIPGDNRFWFTRPYDWKSLLGAKIVFIVLLVDLPMFLARMAAIRAQGFPLFPALWHVLSMQIEMTLVLALPVAAVATLTSGLAQFVLVVFLLIPAASIVTGDASWFNEWAPGEEWVRGMIAAIALIVVSACAVFAQYRNRQTGMMRVAAVLALVVASCVYVFTPVSMAMEWNAWMARPMSDKSMPSATIGAEAHVVPVSDADLEIQIPATVQGIPDGSIVLIDRMFVEFAGSSGTIRRWATLSYSELPSGMLSYVTTIRVPRSFFDAENGKAVNIRTSIDAFYFATSQSQGLHLTETFEQVVGGLRCRGVRPVVGMGTTYYGVACVTPVGWHDRIIQVESKNAQVNPPSWIASYSPFPSGGLFQLESVDLGLVGVSGGIDGATIKVSDFPQRLHRDFEFHDVTMATTMKLH